MLSKKMACLLRHCEDTLTHQYSRDGRTISALESRGIVKHVKFMQATDNYRWKLTHKGQQLRFQLRLLSEESLLEIVK